MKELKNNRKKDIVKIGDRFGNLTVYSKPYMIGVSGHKRQHVDCKCDCGVIRENVNSAYLKRGTVIYYCSRDCEIYKKDNPLPYLVPKNKIKTTLGTKINYLEVIEEAFYSNLVGHAGRHKCVRVKCKCGNEKIYREDKFLKGVHKSCGCIREKADKNLYKTCIKCNVESNDFVHNYNICRSCTKIRNVKHIYGLSEKQYLDMLEKSQGFCEICNKNSSLCIDHCHKTNKVRGLICNNCNAGIGFLEENINIFESCIEYLKKYNENKHE